MADLPTHPGPEDDGRRDMDLCSSLSLLPERQRYAVVYHYLGGLPYKEVAAIIGGSTDAARRAAADGVATLRRKAGQIPVSRRSPCPAPKEPNDDLPA